MKQLSPEVKFLKEYFYYLYDIIAKLSPVNKKNTMIDL